MLLLTCGSTRLSGTSLSLCPGKLYDAVSSRSARPGRWQRGQHCSVDGGRQRRPFSQSRARRRRALSVRSLLRSKPTPAGLPLLPLGPDGGDGAAGGRGGRAGAAASDRRPHRSTGRRITQSAAVPPPPRATAAADRPTRLDARLRDDNGFDVYSVISGGPAAKRPTESAARGSLEQTPRTTARRQSTTAPPRRRSRSWSTSLDARQQTAG